MENRFDEILDLLLDEDNNDIIILANENGNIEFEQIALIPQKEKLYVILKPVVPIDGLGEDEGLVFFINEEEKNLMLVTDEQIIDEVFDVYFSLVEEDEDE